MCVVIKNSTSSGKGVVEGNGMVGLVAIDVSTHEGVRGKGVRVLEEVGENAERVVEGEGGEGEGEEFGGEECVVDVASENGLGEDLVEVV